MEEKIKLYKTQLARAIKRNKGLSHADLKTNKAV